MLNMFSCRILPIVCVIGSVTFVSQAAEPIDIGSHRELFVDDHVIGKIEGDARLDLQQPVPRDVAVVTSKPWEGNTCAYYTVFADTDASGKALFRMYYRGSNYNRKRRDQTHRQVVCYAESRDAIHWTKPKLGLIEFGGSKENNIVWDGAGSHCFTPSRTPVRTAAPTLATRLFPRSTGPAGRTTRRKEK
ncbi:MAG: hypothetical protein CM1200mP2_38300 [Planctomycetaceae bacterium]|nr:MAG: hypothetical protein CM1200mP2_38300 [Planctomycetaceae bacterium]